MRFEVVNTSGKVVFRTEYTECIPDSDQIDAMTSAGYKCKIDGSTCTKSKVKEIVSERRSSKSRTRMKLI